LVTACLPGPLIAMLSIVIPTPSSAAFESAAAHLKEHAGDLTLQMLHAPGPSFAADCNAAVKLAAHPHILIVSPAAQLLSHDYLPRLLGHLRAFDAVAITGTLLLSAPGWHQSGPPYLLGQHLYPLANGRVGLVVYRAPRPIVGGAQALSGPLFAFRKSLLQAISFDEEAFPSQELAVTDLTYRAALAGHRLAVACDLPTCLRENHVYPADWQLQHARFRQKHAATLRPLSPRKFSFLTLEFADIASALPYMNPSYWSFTAQPMEDRGPFAPV
jgi:hypothetical protein